MAIITGAIYFCGEYRPAYMGFEIVYNLGRKLFHDGFKVEGRGRNGDMSGHDNDGGYALKHRWL